MPPRRPRKPVHRPAPREQDDLIALLLEQTVPSTPAAWFESPWKDGRNAIRLAVTLAEPIPATLHSPRAFLLICLDGEVMNSTAYWQASKFRNTIRADAFADPCSAVALERAMEMYMRWASRSDGGGLGYNMHLSSICEYMLEHGRQLEEIEPIVRKGRQRDFVGVAFDDPEPADEQMQRRLRAFETAWKAGLFKVAFCV